MFTGLVESMGTVLAVVQNTTTASSAEKAVPATVPAEGKSLFEAQHVLTIRSDDPTYLRDAQLGDSIACDGVCLTVTALLTPPFTVGVAPETLRKTHLGDVSASDRLNLERAAVLGTTRLGGHLVQGHVDVPIVVRDRKIDPPDALLVTLAFQNPVDAAQYGRYVVPKGYVCLDGASLTVVDVDPVHHTFRVMLVAYTQAKITLPRKPIGGRVNLEVDQVGKYVEQCVGAGSVGRDVAQSAAPH
ncbi:hypothetical protein CXG81DRAFT_30436 [Caulochytrium protostelioides]|uniref:Riboflavin synthase n=1 Tax=Caulochytrium protostelioides TaxID=1555241 RepID=A0A4P9X0J4_9FUNG|nr:Lumazine-binding protein [Caulochytrium protostelioides]RKO98543.1 hypothetical protein CXG81DRAFT_30436 [Caulochytrium protostelioides]|eukprot:RKO98543.1 hypothetical protein CXG81DRAFT_30436 [Caulochytrium protostelioides]